MTDDRELVCVHDTDTWKFKRDKDSRAVIATDGERAVLLHWIGFDLYHEIQNVGEVAEEMGLVHDVPGVWVWEGAGEWQEGPYEYPLDGEYLLVGDFRALTKEEWIDVRKGYPPWDEKEWLVPPTDTKEAL